MTAMYDHLYVYLCQKEYLLKYFDQTLYYTVLCGRSNHLSSVLLCLKGNKTERSFRGFGKDTQIEIVLSHLFTCQTDVY